LKRFENGNDLEEAPSLNICFTKTHGIIIIIIIIIIINYLDIPKNRGNKSVKEIVASSLFQQSFEYVNSLEEAPCPEFLFQEDTWNNWLLM